MGSGEQLRARTEKRFPQSAVGQTRRGSLQEAVTRSRSGPVQKAQWKDVSCRQEQQKRDAARTLTHTRRNRFLRRQAGGLGPKYGLNPEPDHVNLEGGEEVHHGPKTNVVDGCRN